MEIGINWVAVRLSTLFLGSMIFTAWAHTNRSLIVKQDEAK